MTWATVLIDATTSSSMRGGARFLLDRRPAGGALQQRRLHRGRSAEAAPWASPWAPHYLPVRRRTRNVPRRCVVRSSSLLRPLRRHEPAADGHLETWVGGAGGHSDRARPSAALHGRSSESQTPGAWPLRRQVGAPGLPVRWAMPLQVLGAGQQVANAGSCHGGVFDSEAVAIPTLLPPVAIEDVWGHRRKLSRCAPARTWAMRCSCASWPTVSCGQGRCGGGCAAAGIARPQLPARGGGAAAKDRKHCVKAAASRTDPRAAPVFAVKARHYISRAREKLRRSTSARDNDHGVSCAASPLHGTVFTARAAPSHCGLASNRHGRAASSAAALPLPNGFAAAHKTLQKAGVLLRTCSRGAAAAPLFLPPCQPTSSAPRGLDGPGRWLKSPLMAVATVQWAPVACGGWAMKRERLSARHTRRSDIPVVQA